MELSARLMRKKMLSQAGRIRQVTVAKGIKVFHGFSIFLRGYLRIWFESPRSRERKKNRCRACNYVVTEVDKVCSARHYQCTGGEQRTCEQTVFKGGVLVHLWRGFGFEVWAGVPLQKCRH